MKVDADQSQQVTGQKVQSKHNAESEASVDSKPQTHRHTKAGEYSGTSSQALTMLMSSDSFIYNLGQNYLPPRNFRVFP